MSREIRAAAGRWLADRIPAVVVEVMASLGSTPREAGTRMLVAADAVVGTIGGGHLELQAIGRAREMLRAGQTTARTEHIALGPTLGQCCGGAVTLRHAPLTEPAAAAWTVGAPRFHLQLYGAGHVGRAIAALLCPLEVEVDWIDEREVEFPARTPFGTAWPPHIRRVCVDAVDAEVRLASAGGFYLVLTHDHDLDLRITEAILRRGDFGFLGLIGSKTKRRRFFRRFEQRGIAAATVERITCPIGIAGIVGKEPEVIALAVVAQLLQVASASNAASVSPVALVAST